MVSDPLTYDSIKVRIQMVNETMVNLWAMRLAGYMTVHTYTEHDKLKE